MPLVVRPCRGGPELASGGDEVRANYEVITRRLPKLDEKMFLTPSCIAIDV